MPVDVLLLIAVALIFGLINGAIDSCNIVATVISARALSPQAALSLAALAVFCGPFLLGVAVAKTIGSEVVLPGSVTLPAVICAFLAAILWSLVTWFFGIPSSASHALVGGIVGAVAISSGFETIQMGGLSKIILSLFVSPLLGLAAGYLTTLLLFYILYNATPRANWFLKQGQILTAFALALGHGANDSQKIMGGMMIGLLAAGTLSSFTVPLWVIVISAATLALGTAIGGWRLIKTLGGKFYKIKPLHGFSAQASSAVIIWLASLLGGPVSTTHIVSTAILGAGSAERPNMVRWGVAGNIAIAWFITIPAAAGLSSLLYLALSSLSVF